MIRVRLQLQLLASYCLIFAFATSEAVASTACDVAGRYASLMSEVGELEQTIVNMSVYEVRQITGPTVEILGDLYVVPDTAGLLKFCKIRTDLGLSQTTAWNSAKLVLAEELGPLARSLYRLSSFKREEILHNVSTDIIDYLRSLRYSEVTESNESPNNYQLPDGRWISVSGSNAISFIHNFGPIFNILRELGG